MLRFSMVRTYNSGSAEQTEKVKKAIQKQYEDLGPIR